MSFFSRIAGQLGQVALDNRVSPAGDAALLINATDALLINPAGDKLLVNEAATLELSLISWQSSFWVEDPAFTPPPSSNAMTTEQIPNRGNDGTAMAVTPGMAGPVYWAVGTGFHERPALEFSKVADCGLEQVFAAPMSGAVRSFAGILRFSDLHATRFAVHMSPDGADWTTGMGLGMTVVAGAGPWRMRHGTGVANAGTLDTEPHLFVLVGDDAGNERLYIDGTLIHSAALGSGASAGLRLGTVGTSRARFEANWWGVYDGDLILDAEWPAFLASALAYIDNGGARGEHPLQATVDALPNGTIDGVTGHITWSVLDLTAVGTVTSDVPLYVDDKEYVRIIGGGLGEPSSMLVAPTDGRGTQQPSRHFIEDPNWPRTRSHIMIEGGHHVWVDGVSVVGHNFFIGSTDWTLEAQNAFDVNACDDSLIENCLVQGVYGDAWYCTGDASRGVFRWNDVYITGRQGIVPAQCRQCEVYNCRFFAIGRWVLDAEPPDVVVATWDFKFEHNEFFVEAKTPFAIQRFVYGTLVLSYNEAHFGGIGINGDNAADVEMIDNLGHWHNKSAGLAGNAEEVFSNTIIFRHNVTPVPLPSDPWQRVRIGTTVVDSEDALTNSTTGIALV